MKDLRIFSLMGGALILAWLLAPKSPQAAPSHWPRRDLAADGRAEPQDIGPFQVDESFVPQRYVH